MRFAFAFLLMTVPVGVQAQLDTPVDFPFNAETYGRLETREEVHRYTFTGQQHHQVTIRVQVDNASLDSLGSNGRSRLLSSDGTVLAEGVEETRVIRIFRGFFFDATYVFRNINAFTLPADDTYTVEVYGERARAPGFYLITVTAPQDPWETDTGALLRQYAPILHLFEDDFRPKEVQAMLQESDLRDNLGSVVSNPTAADLAALDPLGGHSDELDLRGATPGSTPTVPPVNRFDAYTTAIYGRSSIDTATAANSSNLPALVEGREYRILQYWMFYPYNNFVWRDMKGKDRPGNNHEGDWEMIQLILDPTTRTPVYVVYSWHWAGTVYAWEDVHNDNNHPHVYVAKGGHANWARGGVNFFRFGIARGDITPDLGDQLGPEAYTIIPIPSGDRSAPDDWNSFTGMWGESNLVIGTSGPRSPRYIAYGSFAPIIRWEDPIAWANSPVPTFWHALANSPVNLTISDTAGNRVGVLSDGSTATEIPGLYEFSSSDDGPEYVTIFTADTLTFTIEGTGTGTMDFFVASSGSAGLLDVSFEDVPITTSFIGTFATNDPLHALSVDTDGDGTVDLQWISGHPVPLLLSPIVQATEEVVHHSGNGGGGKRGGPGRGGTALAINYAQRIALREEQSAPSALVLTGRNASSLSSFISFAQFAQLLCEEFGITPDDVLPRTVSAQGHALAGYSSALERLGLSVFSDSFFDVELLLSPLQQEVLSRELQRRIEE